MRTTNSKATRENFLDKRSSQRKSQFKMRMSNNKSNHRNQMKNNQKLLMKKVKIIKNRKAWSCSANKRASRREKSLRAQKPSLVTARTSNARGMATKRMLKQEQKRGWR